ncbi:MAG: class I tRNA ligase family protein [Bacteroidales bacterium]|jgi:leucyl-tRNA synthetase|nr:class I tRNA ligase family protein [Bacteroidales bacterium]
MEPNDAGGEEKQQVLAGEACWTEDGKYIRSSNSEKNISIDGLNKSDGIKTINNWLEKQEIGKATINYKIRDWLFSRQRYWGEPFPVIHWEDGEITILDDEQLPLELPELEKFEPGDNGESPLANSGDWLNVVDKNGRKGRRETNTMPQWAGSCWYYLRYIDPKNDDEPFSKAKENYWMPVDLYIGGAEHAVLHLLYSRFWHKVLFDLGVVSTDEPYKKLYNQGMILAFAYETVAGAKVASDLVEEKEGNYFHTETGEELKQIVAKMSKSLKNVVNPDDVVSTFGADSLRLYEMFLGPLDATKPWVENGVKGVYNFLNKAHRFFMDDSNLHDGEEDAEILKSLNFTIKKVGEDVEKLHFNTAISQMMIFTNLASKKGKVTTNTAKSFTQVLAPFAPHLAEEIWRTLGANESIALSEWPKFEEKYLVEDSIEYPVMINGKMRFKLKVAADTSKEDLEKMALKNEADLRWTGGEAPKKVIVVPKKIINIVV